jgi:hypothetical protein
MQAGCCVVFARLGRWKLRLCCFRCDVDGILRAGGTAIGYSGIGALEQEDTGAATPPLQAVQWFVDKSGGW